MSAESKSRPSFSRASRWQIGFDVVLRTALVLAVVVMANYLGTKFFYRFYLSSQTDVKLSSRTLTVLRSLTNHVDVTLYYDSKPEENKANFYPTIVALLEEYRAANKNISVRTVDYVRDAGAAEQVKEQYKQFFSAQSDKDLVIFDCGGRVKVFPGAALTQYKTVQVAAKDPSQKELEFERRPVAFNGELAFTSMLLGLANPQPLKAYFLQGHGEPSLTDSGNIGYQKFASVLQQNYVSVTNLNWLGNAGVPLDCNLLVIAAPSHALNDTELQQVDQYLHEGGRLLILFNYATQAHPNGLEPILLPWGINVLDDIAQDPDHTISTRDIVVDQFGKHPVVNSLSAQLQLYLPRPIIKINRANLPANAPDVDELFATSAGATLLGNRAEPPHNYPLACAVEQKPVAGTTNPRGNTRIVAVGDSVFLGNYYIDSGGNRDFLTAAVNWLCDRPQLLDGIGPRPVKDFRLQITRHQRQQLRWLLLGALPGGVLFLGWLVWLVRRK
jgi:hypothetical protein